MSFEALLACFLQHPLATGRGEEGGPGGVAPIDAGLVSWYGPRIRRAIEALRPMPEGLG